VPPAGDEPVAFHAVEVMAQRRAADAGEVGDLLLGGGGLALEGDRDEPARQGAACADQGFVEGAADRLGGGGQRQAQRCPGGSRHVSDTNIR
jgi:hypothetical protein